MTVRAICSIRRIPGEAIPCTRSQLAMAFRRRAGERVPMIRASRLMLWMPPADSRSNDASATSISADSRPSCAARASVARNPGHCDSRTGITLRRSTTLEKRRSSFAGSSIDGRSDERAYASSAARETPRTGRATMPSPRRRSSGMPAIPRGPAPRNRFRRTVSMWSSSE